MLDPEWVYQKVLDENDKQLNQGRGREDGQEGEVTETKVEWIILSNRLDVGSKIRGDSEITLSF